MFISATRLGRSEFIPLCIWLLICALFPPLHVSYYTGGLLDSTPQQSLLITAFYNRDCPDGGSPASASASAVVVGGFASSSDGPSSAGRRTLSSTPCRMKAVRPHTCWFRVDVHVVCVWDCDIYSRRRAKGRHAT